MLLQILKFIRQFFPMEKIKEIQGKLLFPYRCWVRASIANIGKAVYFSTKVRIRGGGKIKIGNNCFINNFCIIEALEEYASNDSPYLIEIGSNCNFGEFTHITAMNKVIIGDGVLTGRFVTITDNSHGNNNKDELVVPPFERNVCSKGVVVIGSNVWLGDKVTILPNVKIGDGAIIGANSVVTKDIPPCCVAVGIPAKIVKSKI